MHAHVFVHECLRAWCTWPVQAKQATPTAGVTEGGGSSAGIICGVVLGILALALVAGIVRACTHTCMCMTNASYGVHGADVHKEREARPFPRTLVKKL